MGLLNELMTPDQANRALSWVDGMLSKNLRPTERKRFLKAKTYLESQLEAQKKSRERSLLQELQQVRNPSLFSGEEIIRIPTIPGG